MISALFTAVTDRIEMLRTQERGAVAIGWLALGVVIGIALVIFAIVKFLIPGE